MYKLSSIDINGFWGRKKVRSDFSHDINIFIGKNGTGKTTFIKILHAVLSVDIQLLSTLEFESVIVNLSDNNKTKKIAIERITNNTSPYMSVRYKISKKVYEFFLLPKDSDYPRKRVFHPNYIEKINECKREMNSIIKLNWISVHREVDTDIVVDPYRQKREISDKPAVDIRLEVLMQLLIEYQLSLQYKFNILSSEFQKNILKALLYNEKFDKFKFTEWQSSESAKIKEGLVHAYKDLGAYDTDIEKKIDDHSIKIESSIKNLKDTMKKNLAISIGDVLPLVLLNRTNYIINLSTDLEKEKNKIFSQIYKYEKILEEYMTDKFISFDPIRSGQLKIERERQEISFLDLSSGEKQIIILLTEALLQKEEPCIFIADEPELSLHIDWQKKLIQSIKNLNTNAQIIVATHSPEIAGMWVDNIINMEDLFL